MRILLSNDDGYFAPGLAALAEGLAPLGDITVVAPERDRSGASNSLTLDRPLMLSPRAERLPLRERHADRLRAHGGHGAARLRARRGRLGHQSRLEHGRRHALFGHGRGGHRGIPARHPVDRGLAGGPRIPRTTPPPRGWPRDLVRAPGARALRRPGAAQRERARRALRRARGHGGDAPRAAPQGAARGREQESARGDRVLGRRRPARRARPGPGTDFHALERGAVSVTPAAGGPHPRRPDPAGGRLDGGDERAQRHRHDLGAHARCA